VQVAIFIGEYSALAALALGGLLFIVAAIVGARVKPGQPSPYKDDGLYPEDQPLMGRSRQQRFGALDQGGYIN
jgi:hypothetical protein